MTPFLGEIRMFGGSFVPQGWAEANGAVIPISQNDALFNLYGTTYGGDGVQNFGLPNLWGRVPIHDGTGTDGVDGQGRQRYLSPYALGATGGLEKVPLIDANHPAHTHAFSVSNVTATASTLALASKTDTMKVLAAPTTINLYYQGSAARAMGPSALAQAGGTGAAHENRMPSLAIKYIVALGGVFPSRG